MISIEEKLNQLFDKYSKVNGLVGDIAKRGFAYSKVENKKILFVGINPSYPAGSTPESFSYSIQDAVKNYPRHFKKFQDLADNSSAHNEWTYLDIFYHRETEQDKINLLLKSENGLNFIIDQLRITIELIESLQPKLIVICNSRAKSFFGLDMFFNIKSLKQENVWMGYEVKFDEKFGVEIITGKHKESLSKIKTSLTATPILVSGVLTYMDSNTKKRLAWQIRQILNFGHLFLHYNDCSNKIDPLKKHIEFLYTNSEKANELKKFFVKTESFQLAKELKDKELGYYERIEQLMLLKLKKQ